MFAKVLLVQTRNSSKLALKVVRRSIRPHGCALDSELCMLKHPFIVPMHLVFATDTKCYTLMEYIDGTSLAAHLVQSHIFSEEQARVILAELLSALVEVHAHKIVHRNVRPASILLDRHGHVYLTNFGAAAKVGSDGELQGTVSKDSASMAPEMLDGATYGVSVDVWSFGVVGYELLCGAHPFVCHTLNGTSVVLKTRRARVDVPTFLSTDAVRLLRNLLKQSPSDRAGCGVAGLEEVRNVRPSTVCNHESQPSDVGIRLDAGLRAQLFPLNRLRKSVSQADRCPIQARSMSFSPTCRSLRPRTTPHAPFELFSAALRNIPSPSAVLKAPINRPGGSEANGCSPHLLVGALKGLGSMRVNAA